MATARRDALLELQGAAQAKWAAAAAFEAEAPTDPSRVKFFGNFPYPYMVRRPTWRGHGGPPPPPPTRLEKPPPGSPLPEFPNPRG